MHSQNKTMYKVNLCKIYIKSICTNCCLFTRFKKVCDITGRPIARGAQGHVHLPFTLKGRARGGTLSETKRKKMKKINEGNEKGKKEGGEKIGNFYFYPVL